MSTGASASENPTMAEDAEKRFHNVMDKIFNDTTSNSSSPPLSGKSTRGQKRPRSLLESKFRGDKGDVARQLLAEAPSCRPWERGDLFRRLATFKSMTWFAKTKVIDAVSCARRGWVNADLDTIACELCGARLLFPVPSSWPREQVEKAASVFSLKLDNGHKLPCPWVNNACDATLALFPPTPALILVDHYRQRFSALLRLAALPRIPVSAVESMRTPQLEDFLEGSAKETSVGDGCSSPRGDLAKNNDTMSSNLYHQAPKLLSLCGWEPRLLPYIVGSNDLSSKVGGQSTSLVIYSGSGERAQADEGSSLSGSHYDTCSTVLECKLCKATMGLWTFSTVPQPIESFRVIGYTEITDRDLASTDSATENDNDVSSSGKENASVNGTLPTLNLTIAGGPPPAKQNFKARVSLPVVGRNLRARLLLQSFEDGNVGEVRDTSFDSISEGTSEGTAHIYRVGSRAGPILDLAEHLEKCSQGTSESCVDGISQMVTTQALSQLKTMLDASNGVQNADQVQRMAQTSFGQNAATSNASETLKGSSDKEMEFHPIKQHRYFCPWITSSDSIAPGWQQTLLALQKERVSSPTDFKDSPPSCSLIKVDDPVKSIRLLFNSPTKRMKTTHLAI
ncbi:hypothetical protein Drorol1_Dr00006570 [Drosera rotundifolia]